MVRILGLLLLLAVVGYGIWPYTSIFRLNSALESADAQTLAPMVDLAAIQAHYKARINDSVSGILPEPDSNQQSEAGKVIGWLKNNLQQLGDAALDQAITLDWVRNALIDASQRANAKAGGSFINAVDFAFFESWNRFVIRLGELGQQPTFVILKFEAGEWRLTDITG